METIKFKLFVLELRNIGPERVTDWYRVSQPFMRDTGLQQGSDFWSRLFKLKHTSTHQESLLFRSQVRWLGDIIKT